MRLENRVLKLDARRGPALSTSGVPHPWRAVWLSAISDVGSSTSSIVFSLGMEPFMT